MSLRNHQSLSLAVKASSTSKPQSPKPETPKSKEQTVNTLNPKPQSKYADLSASGFARFPHGIPEMVGFLRYRLKGHVSDLGFKV